MNIGRGTMAKVGSLVVTMALLGTGCREVTEPSVRAGGGVPTPTFSHIAYGNGFFQYPSGALLHDYGWTRIVRWPSSGQEILGDWRIRDSVAGALGTVKGDWPGGRAVRLENPPLDQWDVRVIEWDTLPTTLGPPVDILAHLWIPSTRDYPRVGVAWFIQEPDGNPTCLGAACGELNAFAVVRNMLSSRDDGFFIVRYFDDVYDGIWSGTARDRLKNTWVWMRVQHTITGQSGTIRFRVWKGTRADEPSQWDLTETSTWFGLDGGSPGPGISGRAGLIAEGHPDMANAELYWDMFAVSSDSVPCDGVVTTILSEYQDFRVNLQPTCGDFATDGGTTHFSWDELNGHFAEGNPHQPWGMVRDGLTTGLEATRTNYNRGGIVITSGYRCPHGNTAVNSPAPHTSWHMHGRAADMKSEDHPWVRSEFDLLRLAASETVPAPEELLDWDHDPIYHHLHAAW